MSEIRAILLWCQSSMYELLRFPSENTLVALQGAVYGRIERVPTTVEFEGVEMEMWVNEEGLLDRLPYNPEASALCGMPIFGNAVLTKVGDVQ